MAAIFPKSSDIILKVAGALLGAGALMGICAYAYYTYPTNIDTGYQPVQPVPYSHKLHAGQLGLDCYYCHFTVYKAAYAAVPPTETCMNCHTRVKTTSPRLEVGPAELRDRPGDSLGADSSAFQITFILITRRTSTAGVSCVSCHGRIDQMIEVHQEKPLNMAFCLECHRNPAPNIRPAELVTKLDWVPDRDPAEIGREIIAAKHINPPTNCSGCHR